MALGVSFVHLVCDGERDGSGPKQYKKKVADSKQGTTVLSLGHVFPESLFRKEFSDGTRGIDRAGVVLQGLPCIAAGSMAGSGNP
jgi:hypothetical protein